MSRNWGSSFFWDSSNFQDSIKMVWHKHNLIISSSVGSGHPGKYWYEIPHEYLLGWGNLLGKINSLIWIFFFDWGFLFSNMMLLFQSSFIFGETTSSHIFRVAISTQQLIFRSSYFFKAAVFWVIPCSEQRHLVFAEVIFSETHFFRAKLLSSSHLLL